MEVDFRILGFRIGFQDIGFRRHPVGVPRSVEREIKKIPRTPYVCRRQTRGASKRIAKPIFFDVGGFLCFLTLKKEIRR
jgi:hypothetical protein